MRDYGVVSPQFWIGKTGKEFRGKPELQVLALYLMTSPHSSMTGVYHCPILYMAHETGLSFEGASKGLASLIEGGFCQYDEASETVFVVRMAAFQIGESLKPDDKRVAGLRKEVEKMPAGRIRAAFLGVYGEAFCLTKAAENTSPSEAPSKPLRSQEQDQEQDQKQERAGRAAAKRGTRLPADWQPSPEELRWAADARPDIAVMAEVETFRDYWIAKPGVDGCKLDWHATWRNWIRRSRSSAGNGVSFRKPEPIRQRRELA